ncbi:MAG: ribosome-binding factor A, partial [Bacteroidia bacterium]
MDSTRQQKVSRLLQKELANAFQRELQTIIDKSLVTFTAVRISPDLSVAKIYISIFPPAKRESV